MTKLFLTMRASIKLLFAAIPPLSVANEFEAFSMAPLNHTEVQPIVGGTEIVPGSRPYLVALEGCGGSLISPRAVLTAAHCCFTREGDWDPPRNVVFNRHNTDEPADEFTINLANTEIGGDVVPHPRYNLNGNADLDVAILFLPIAMNEIMPITLNLDPNIPAQGDPLEVTGWGLTSTDGDSSNVPLSVDLDYIPTEACTELPFRWSPEAITDNMLCAFGDQKDSCEGDSGGPLVLGSPQGGPLEPFVQVGIVSFGPDEETGEGCASSIYPGVYTRVSSVADWVRSTVCNRVGELCTIASKAGKAKTRKD